MKQLVFFLLIAFAFTSCTDHLIEEDFERELDSPTEITSSLNRSSTNVEDLQIIEGVGLGDVVTLGMTRDQIRQLAPGAGCESGSECTFKLSPETGAIKVHFTNNKVDAIDLFQYGIFPDYLWSTTKGVTSLTPPDEVAATYENSVVEKYSVYTNIIAASYGYTFASYQTFGDIGSNRVVRHLIYSPDGGGQIPETVRSFMGQIVLKNTRRKRKTYQVNLTITAPDGQVTQVPTFSRTIGGNGSVRINPENYLSTDGPLGTYSYSADLLINRKSSTIKASTSTGTFKLIESVQ